MSKLNTIIYNRTRKAIDKAYLAYLSDKASGETALFTAVLDFALSKINSATFEMGEGESTSEDHAQEVAIYVWQHLEDFKGEPEAFYSWLHRICYVKGAEAFEEVKEEAAQRVPMFVEAEDGSGFMEDNPLLYRDEKDDTPARILPTWIKGVNLAICTYIRGGLEYAEIGELLGLTENAVNKRVIVMRERAMKDAKSKKA